MLRVTRLFLMLSVCAVAAGCVIQNDQPGPVNSVAQLANSNSSTQSQNQNSNQTPTLTPTPSPISTSTPTPVPPPSDTPLAEPTSSPSFVGIVKLIIPVAGVQPTQLIDTFSDARSEGRVHDAIDIPAPGGTPVLAAADGEIVKLFQSERGGTTIYQLSADKKLVFYYAHLQSYATDLQEGQFKRQGEVIGFVGDTGNAGAGNYHLHFSIAVLADPKRYWDGSNINPYPILHGK